MQSIEFRKIGTAKSVEKIMYMRKYEVFFTVFENWINNMILTTENCNGVIKNTVFSSSMSIALDNIFFFHKLVHRLQADIFRTQCAWHIPSTDIFKMAAKTAKIE